MNVDGFWQMIGSVGCGDPEDRAERLADQLAALPEAEIESPGLGHAAGSRSVVPGKAIRQRQRQFFRRRPWRSLRALAPCEMHLDETGLIVLDAEQNFITPTATGQSDDRLTEQRMPFADLKAELSLQDLPGMCVRQQHPRLRQWTRLRIEQVIDAGIQPAIRPRRRPSVSRGEPAASRASPELAEGCSASAWMVGR
jgi:hypothetical protein